MQTLTQLEESEILQNLKDSRRAIGFNQIRCLRNSDFTNRRYESYIECKKQFWNKGFVFNLPKAVDRVIGWR